MQSYLLLEFGENESKMREKICENVKFLGVEIDYEKNEIRGEETEISTKDSKIKVFIIPTNEELVIARDTMNLVKN